MIRISRSARELTGDYISRGVAECYGLCWVLFGFIIGFCCWF